MTAEEGRGRRGHDGQVSRNRDKWKRRGARHGNREAKSEAWSVRSDKASYKETEEDGMSVGNQEGKKDKLTASPWGTHESWAGGRQVDTRAGGRDKRTAPSATTDNAGTQGRHEARLGQGKKEGGNR